MADVIRTVTDNASFQAACNTANGFDCVGQAANFRIQLTNSFVPSGISVGAGTSSDDYKVIVEAAPGMGHADLANTGAYNYGNQGIELTLNNDSAIIAHSGVWFHNLRITSNAYHGFLAQSGGNGVLPRINECKVRCEAYGAIGIQAYQSLEVYSSLFVRSSTSGGPLIDGSWSLTAFFSTFVLLPGATAEKAHSGGWGGQYSVLIDNLYVGFANPYDGSFWCVNNYSNYGSANNCTVVSNIVVDTSNDFRAGSSVRGLGTSEMISTLDGRGNNRGNFPDPGAVMYNPAEAAAIPTITSQTFSNGTLTLSGTYTNNATGGLLVVDPLYRTAGVPRQQTSSISINSGNKTFSVTLSGMPREIYRVPVMRLSNTGGLGPKATVGVSAITNYVALGANPTPPPTILQPNRWQPAWSSSTNLGDRKVEHRRNGQVLATYGELGDLLGPDQRYGGTQFPLLPGDEILVYPARYYKAVWFGMPSGGAGGNSSSPLTGVTVRGLTINGERPVIWWKYLDGTEGQYGYAKGNGAIYGTGVVYVGYTGDGCVWDNIDIIDVDGWTGKSLLYINNGVEGMVTFKNMRVMGAIISGHNGILSAHGTRCGLTFENVETAYLGGGATTPPDINEALAHGYYITRHEPNAQGVYPQINFKGCYFHHGWYGHLLKVRNPQLTVEGCYFMGVNSKAFGDSLTPDFWRMPQSGAAPSVNDSAEVSNLDMPNGGTLTFINNVVVKNYTGRDVGIFCLNWGAESNIGWSGGEAGVDGKITIENNTFVAMSNKVRVEGSSGSAVPPVPLGFSNGQDHPTSDTWPHDRVPVSIRNNVYAGFVDESWKEPSAQILTIDQINLPGRDSGVPFSPKVTQGSIGTNGGQGRPMYAHRTSWATRTDTNKGGVGDFQSTLSATGNGTGQLPMITPFRNTDAQALSGGQNGAVAYPLQYEWSVTGSSAVTVNSGTAGAQADEVVPSGSSGGTGGTGGGGTTPPDTGGGTTGAPTNTTQASGAPVNFTAAKLWSFDTDTQGWVMEGYGSPSGGPNVFDVQMGTLRVFPNYADNVIKSPGSLGVNGAANPKVQVSVKRVNGSTWEGGLRWITTTDSNWDDVKYKQVNNTINSSGYTTLDWDMSTMTNWTGGTISQIRLDLGVSLDDEFFVDWIAIGAAAASGGGTNPPGSTTGTVTVDRTNALGAKVIAFYPLNGSDGEIVSGLPLTLVAGTYVTDATYGKVLQGSTDQVGATINLDLSTKNQISFSFRAKNIGEKDIFQHGGNWQLNENGGAIMVSGNFGGEYIAGVNHGRNGYAGTGFPHPGVDSAAWNYHIITLDNTNKPEPFATWMVNGTELTEWNSFGTSGTSFKSGLLEIMKTSGGQIQNLTFFDGILSSAERTSLNTNPSQYYKVNVTNPGGGTGGGTGGSGTVTINTSNALGAKVLKYFPFNGVDGEIISGNSLNVNSNGLFITDSTYGKALQLNGAGPAATVNVDLSGHNTITLAFRAKNITNASLIQHVGDPYNANYTTEHGFLVRGRDTEINNTNFFVTNHGSGWSATHFNYDYRNLDDTGWHYHIVTLINTLEGVPHGTWYTDGVANTVNGGYGSAGYKFINGLMSFLLTGGAAIQNLAIFADTLTSAEITSLSNNPAQLVNVATTEGPGFSISSAVIPDNARNTIVLQLGASLDTTHAAPAFSQWSITNHTVTSYTYPNGANSFIVTLIMNSEFAYGDVVKLSYTRPTAPAGFATTGNSYLVNTTNFSVTNAIAAPAVGEGAAISVVSATITNANTNAIVVVLSGNIDTSHAAPPFGQWILTGRTVTGYSYPNGTSGNTVQLTVSGAAFAYGDVVTLGYTRPSAPVGFAAAGNSYLASFSNLAVTNSIPSGSGTSEGTPITILSATVNNSSPGSVSVVLSDFLDRSHADPAYGQWAVTGHSVTAYEFDQTNANKLNLVLNSPVVYGTTLSLGYTRPTAPAGFAASGNRYLSTFSGLSITNNVAYVYVPSDIPKGISAFVMATPSTNPVPTGFVFAQSYQDWLTSDNAARCLLVEVSVLDSGGNPQTIFLSSTGYVTSPTDSPANVHYLPVVSNGVSFSEKLAVDSAQLSYGDIELDNSSAELDPYLSYVWANKAIKIYSGDVRWSRSQFQLIFTGLVENIDSSSRTTLNLKLRDKMQQLNTPLTDVKVGGTSQFKDSLIPLVFGEVHNMTPVLVDAALHTYQFHQRRANYVIEVRDNGAPVVVTSDPFIGMFQLSGSPAGAITCSVQGDMPNGVWPVTVASIIKTIVTSFGKASTRLTLADIDTANFDAFDAANPQPVGFCATNTINVIDACQQLAATVGAQLMFNRLGLLQLVKLQIPGLGTPQAIGPADMLTHTLHVAARPDIQAAVKLGYCKNWTVQANLQTGILEEHKARYATEWDTKTVVNSTVAATYNLDVEPTQRDTMFLRSSEAEVEANRLLFIMGAARTVYEFTGLPICQNLYLGQAVTLTHGRFGLDTGKAGVVVGLDPDWLTGRVVVQVLI